MSQSVAVYFSSSRRSFCDWAPQEIAMSIETITPRQLGDLLREGRRVDLIDVRTPIEFREVHLQAAKNVPLDRLDPKAVMSSARAAAGASRRASSFSRPGLRTS
jgi:hypothetical protein